MKIKIENLSGGILFILLMLQITSLFTMCTARDHRIQIAQLSALATYQAGLNVQTSVSQALPTFHIIARSK